MCTSNLAAELPLECADFDVLVFDQKKEIFQQAIVTLPSQLSDEAAEDLRRYWFKA